MTNQPRYEMIDQGLFVLNVYEIISENDLFFAYIVDSYELWHVRLGHVSFSSIKKL